MQKKINVILHYEFDEEKEKNFICETIAAWYAEIVRQRLLESDLTFEERCIVVDRMLRDIKDREENGAISFAGIEPFLFDSET